MPFSNLQTSYEACQLYNLSAAAPWGCAPEEAPYDNLLLAWKQTLKDQKWSHGLTAGSRTAMTTSPGAGLPEALTKLCTLCQAGLLPGDAVCTSAPAAMSSVTASDSSPRSLVRTRLPPNVAAARTCRTKICCDTLQGLNDLHTPHHYTEATSLQRFMCIKRASVIGER